MVLPRNGRGAVAVGQIAQPGAILSGRNVMETHICLMFRCLTLSVAGYYATILGISEGTVDDLDAGFAGLITHRTRIG